MTFVVKDVPGKGRGLFTNVFIPKGQLIIRYEGEHISEAEAARREDEYGADTCCYMFYYTTRDRKDKKIVHCLDATHSRHESRLINHSKKHANLKPEYVYDHIWFRARRDIEPGTELLFDYNETRKDVLAANPWLKE
mgnify:CR=1 FL=1